MALKTCPACNKQVGPRTKKCECGHTFIESTPAVGAATAPMSLDRALKDSLASAKTVVAEVEARQGSAPVKPSIPTPTPRKTSFQYNSSNASHGGVIAVPAGACPFKPKGSSDEEIEAWAVEVFHSGRYAPEAVVYWAREFWDINGKDFPRIKKTILKALAPQASDPGDNDVPSGG